MGLFASKESYKDKVVWIVGASSGIGEALAKELYSQGAFLILSARNETKLNALKNDLDDEKTRVKILTLDVKVTHLAPEKANEAKGMFGQVDVVILASGLSNRSSVLDTDFEVQMELMMTNFLGLAAITKSILPEIIANKGQIVVLSSIQGKVSLPNRSAYAASKHALHGFFDALRCEVSCLGVKVNLMVLGYVKTNLSLSALKTSVDNRNAVMDKTTEKGFPPDVAAKKIVDAMKRNVEEAVISQWSGIFAIWLKSYWPSMLSRVLQLRGKKLQEESLKSQ